MISLPEPAVDSPPQDLAHLVGIDILYLGMLLRDKHSRKTPDAAPHRGQQWPTALSSTAHLSAVKDGSASHAGTQTPFVRSLQDVSSSSPLFSTSCLFLATDSEWSGCHFPATVDSIRIFR